MISIIIPVYNEKENLFLLNTQIQNALDPWCKDWEVIYIDDGSNDGSHDILQELALNNKRIKLIRLVKQYGQTLAIAAGIEYSEGDILVFMDSDLQNDPRDIPKLISKLDEGYDVVSGWRKQRRDPLFTRVIPSYIGNKLVSLVSGLNLHDVGCGLKAYRRKVITGIKLYGEMHRLLPIYAKINGANITEVVVSHNYRRTGKSKYGLFRIIKLILDLINIKFVQGFYTKPIYFFGSTGIFFILGATLIGIFVIIRKIFFGGMWLSPLIFICFIFFTVGIQMLFTGILAELLIRVYYKSNKESPYKIKSIIENRNIKKT